jgi:hypothetical protein
MPQPPGTFRACPGKTREMERERKLIPSLEVPLCVTCRGCTDAVTLSWVILTLLSPLIYCNGIRTCKQGTADKRKHTTLMISQKFGIIRRLESDESQSGVMDFLQATDTERSQISGIGQGVV